MNKIPILPLTDDQIRQLTDERNALQSDLVECRIALRNSEACREQAEQLALKAQSKLSACQFSHEVQSNAADRAETAYVRAEAERDAARLERDNLSASLESACQELDAARQDADGLAGLLTDALERLENYNRYSSTQINRELIGIMRAALAAHAQATDQAVKK